jgi:hypothetical protein
MYIEIMFADKNNHLIKHFLKKKRSGGTRETPVAETPVAETPVAETPFAETPVAETPVAETPVAETPVAETPEDTNTSYPDTKYLYKNITSTKKTTGIKTNICAFYLQDTHFVKYIVHKEESRVVFPSFVFETNGMQTGGFLDEDYNSTSNLDILFQTNVIDFVKSFFLQPNHTNGSMKLEGGDSKSKEQQQQEVETISSPQQQEPEVEENVDNISSLEQPEEENVDNISSLEQPELEENVDNISSLEQPEVEENVDNISSLEQPEEENVDNISSLEQPEVEENVDNISSLEQPEVEENVDNISSLEQQEEENVDNISSLELENVEPPVPFYYDNLEYIGYILSNDEPYVFVNIGSQKPLNQEYTETILSELFYTFKVFDMDVDMTIRTLFDNNRWLLHDDEPYSGYICKLNEESHLVNDEDSTDIINVESIGDYYYFSFRPLDKNTQKRFAIFPNEYACILDDTQMAQYKSDKMLYAQDRTIYFKGETLRDKKVGHEFMCVKTPSQFTHY